MRKGRSKRTGKGAVHPRKRRVTRRMMEALDLPEEAVGQTPKVTWLGHSDLLVENHAGILQYGAQCVRLFTQEGVLCVSGQTLHMLELGARRAYIRGEITGAAYEK